jgi:hypothetical protein
MGFFNRNAGSIQAMAAILTVVLALAALVGVKWQINAADRIQRAQSARDIYREYLNLAINKPEFAQPDYCKIINTPQEAGYENFVEYLLYTAEQTISVDADWAGTFSNVLKDHTQYICSIENVSGYAESVAGLINTFKSENCKTVDACN